MTNTGYIFVYKMNNTVLNHSERFNVLQMCSIKETLHGLCKSMDQKQVDHIGS
jgi:hypothetical protein